MIKNPDSIAQHFIDTFFEWTGGELGRLEVRYEQQLEDSMSIDGNQVRNVLGNIVTEINFYLSFGGCFKTHSTSFT